MLAIILIGFLSAIIAPFVHKYLPKISGGLLSLVPAGIFLYLVSLLSLVSGGNSTTVNYNWFSSFNINLNFFIDGLGLTFALIISGIGALIVFYSSGYLKGHRKLGRFYGYLLFFMTSMLGVVLSDNIFTLFIFWELTSISSYLLIGFNHEQARSRYAALQALLITGGGGLALLAGLILLGNITGTYVLSEMLSMNQIVTSHYLYFPVLILVLLGAFTKSAQVPFHIWLPNAMEAPTPVSAYLHSATMVKAGVFLIARLNPIFSGPDSWQIILLSFGGVTMLISAAMAIGQNDLKRILAYTTISALGIMVFLIGLGTKYAITGAITFLIVHSLYKGGLFLVAGAIDHETGTRDIRKLGGLSTVLPLIATGGILAALSYSGIPPFFGFIAKELIYEATVHASINPSLLLIAAMGTNMLLVATAIMTGIQPFFSKAKKTPKHPHRAPVTLWLGPVLLGVTGLLFGVLPFIPENSLVGPAVHNIFLHEGAELALWHGFNILLLYSLITLLGGIGFYYLSTFVKKHIAIFNKIEKIGPEAIYNLLLKGLSNFSTATTNFLQNGYLRNYFMWIFGFFLIMVVYSLARFELFQYVTIDFSGIHFYEFLVVVIMLLAAFAAIRSKSVLGSVAALGIVGYGIAIIFGFFSAPDLALTQFSIETLTVILLVLIVYNVPNFKKISSKKSVTRDIIISGSVGVVVTILVLIVLNNPADSKISTFFLENSYLMAHGKNVVNVILVDFRGFDTMGEITVLSVAAIGVYTLLKFRKRNKTLK
ncbi:MAG: putative monovalent cation/H+ antiporter subunit A [Bacteroidales bacterium]|nr:putative monovalent cation/H+ antiporter subunit A [Bacteroidales bacterium]MCF8328283.1 putative monovalent cation/H+ antiporter subunit A [Bacteroidales bacterium]